MSTALKILIEEYAIPRMNCHRIFSTVHFGNEASLGVFRKNGFVQREVAVDAFVIPEQRGGGRRDLLVLEWKRTVE
jgi:RimJ/RimL family protein N-acetyltransferase